MAQATIFGHIGLFVCLKRCLTSQSTTAWSCRDIASTLWDIPKIKNVMSASTETIRLIIMYGWFDLKPLFLGRLRHERLTSNQMVSQ